MSKKDLSIEALLTVAKAGLAKLLTNRKMNCMPEVFVIQPDGVARAVHAYIVARSPEVVWQIRVYSADGQFLAGILSVEPELTPKV